MPFDLSNSPISPSVLIGAALYAGVSFAWSGPVVSDREIAKLNWPMVCEAELAAERAATATPPPISAVPDLNCNDTLSLLFGRDGAALCQDYGSFSIPIPGANALREQEQRVHEAEQRRMALAASRAGSRCDCASAVFQADHRLPLALYAGSARLIAPSQVRNLQSELSRALHSPQCSSE
ncbi:MAG: hypothetical protein ACRBBK_07380 [Paracoccaceae bacterium]